MEEVGRWGGGYHVKYGHCEMPVRVKHCVRRSLISDQNHEDIYVFELSVQSVLGPTHSSFA